MLRQQAIGNQRPPQVTTLQPYQATVRMTGLQPCNMRRATNRKQSRHAVLLINVLYSLASVTPNGKRM
jgi:hypothetical protein